MVILSRLGEPAGYYSLDNLADGIKESDWAPPPSFLFIFNGLTGLRDNDYTGYFKVRRLIAEVEVNGRDISELGEERFAVGAEEYV